LGVDLTTKLIDLENKLDDCSNKDPPPQWSDIVAKHVETKMSEVTADMTTVQDSLEKNQTSCTRTER